MRAVILAVIVASGCGGGHDNWEPAYDAGSVQPATEARRPDELKTPSVEAGLPRKIIHTADISLAVENFDPLPEKVAALAFGFNGYVARSNVAGATGQPRRGNWTIRVPVERFDELLRAVRKLGEPLSIRSDSQDLSEEYFDVESRVRNKKNCEDRLLTLLEESTGNLEQILIVEEKLDQVREEIERIEGRLRVLDDLTSMTTVDLTIDEIRDFAPEQSATYGRRVRRAFGTSVNNLSQAAEDLSLAVVYVLPWLAAFVAAAIVLAVPLVLALKVLDRRRKRIVPASAVSNVD